MDWNLEAASVVLDAASILDESGDKNLQQVATIMRGMLGEIQDRGNALTSTQSQLAQVTAERDAAREELERVRAAQGSEETMYAALAAWIHRTERSPSQMECFLAGWQDCAALHADTTSGKEG